MTNVFKELRDLFTQKQVLDSGFLVYHTPPDAPRQYRLHLRMEPDGEGVLIINAASILHLNQTATEIAYYMIKGMTNAEIVKMITKRFAIRSDLARKDVDAFVNRIHQLIETVDLSPDADLGFETHLNVENISAPYRLDCCLNYDLEADRISLDPQEPSHDLSADDWKKIIDKAYKAAIPHLVFYGGEPTLRDDLLEILKHCEQLGLVSGLVSSGRKLTDPDFVNQLIEAGLDHLMIPWVVSDSQIREALNHILPLDLYTCINIPVQQGTDYRQLIDELKQLGANAFALAPVTEADFSYFLELCEYVEGLKGVDLVQDMPLPVPYDTFSRQEEKQDFEVDDSAFTIMKVDTKGNLHAGFPPYALLGNMVTEEWKTLWERRPGHVVN